MKKILVVCFALCGLSSGEVSCKYSGVRNADGDWNASFALEKWNATNNWTLIVQHKAIEDEGKANSYIRGYLADEDIDVPVHGIRRLWTCEDGNSNADNSPKILRNFGVIPYPEWNITETPKDKILQYWQTSSACTTLPSCRRQLTEIYKEHLRENGRMLDNFHILPDGSILEGLGWDKVFENKIRINLFSKDKSVVPSNLTLEAFAYLAQVAVSLGKLRKVVPYVPPHTSSSVDTEVKRWTSNYKLSFDEDLSVSRVSIDEDLQVISRSEWKAMRPMRELEEANGEAEVVEVKVSSSTCLTYQECAHFVREMQLKQMSTHSDIYSNFVFGRDGRIYEGIGWNRSRKDKVVHMEILAESEGSVPWSHVLAAFTLQLREGVDLGRISEAYTINVASSQSAKIGKWAEWARHILKENITVNLQTGDDSMVTRIDTGNVVRQRNIVPRTHSAGTIHFKQRNVACSRRTDCIPFYKSLGRKSLRSLSDVKCNFYFVDEGEPQALVHEGLGWDLTINEGEVVFEFLTANTLPTNRSMLASSFLIREGLNRGVLRPDYHVTVGKHASIQFENLVRFWDRRIREF